MSLPIPLSPDQMQILRLIADGRTNKEIAVKLYRSVTATQFHVAQLRNLMGARNRAHAVAIAYEHGVLTPGGAR